MVNSSSLLIEQDPQVYAAMKCEVERQRNKLEMIASENFVSEAVLRATASVMTNKYAEGYPEHRYYGGCEHVDQVESLALARARKLFRAEHVNVQPHCGSSANLAAYLAVMAPGESLLAMTLSHGGHLTHGSPMSITGRFFQPHYYGVHPDTELIDYDKLLQMAEEIKPKVIVAGTSSYPRIIDFEKFREAADRAGATLVVDMAHFAGLVAAGLYPSPVGLAEIVTSTTHKTLRGPRGGMIICKNNLAKQVDDAVFPGLQGGPLMHVIAAKAVAFNEALNADFIDYQHQVLKNAARLADNLSQAGFRLVSGGTDTHLILLDLRPQKITGDVAAKALDAAGITANKNSIPYDTAKSTVTSGLRLGTPALTTRGMREAEMDLISGFIVDVLKKPEDEIMQKKVLQKIDALCQKFPLYPGK